MPVNNPGFFFLGSLGIILLFFVADGIRIFRGRGLALPPVALRTLCGVYALFALQAVAVVPGWADAWVAARPWQAFVSFGLNLLLPFVPPALVFFALRSYPLRARFGYAAVALLCLWEFRVQLIGMHLYLEEGGMIYGFILVPFLFALMVALGPLHKWWCTPLLALGLVVATYQFALPLRTGTCTDVYLYTHSGFAPDYGCWWVMW